MSNISNPLQLHADRPLEPERYATLVALEGILKRLDCLYMLVGATARDILLYNVFGQQIMRATQDVDIAISIDSWERFTTVKSEILRTPDFQPSTAQPYRVLHKTHGAAYATPIDILPFGEIATECRSLSLASARYRFGDERCGFWGRVTQALSAVDSRPGI